MYRFRKDGISVLAIVDKRRMKNNGLYPVKIEVVYRRIQRYFPTGIDVSLAEWDKLWRARRISKKCASIENSFHLVRDAVEKLAEKGEFGFDRLEMMMGRNRCTINEALEDKMKLFLVEGKINSFYRYRNTLHAIEKFAGKKIEFHTITASWLKRCEIQWIKEGKSCTTVNIYMKALRCIFCQAVDEGRIRNGMNPFGRNGYKIPTSATRKLALGREQIERIRSWSGNREVEYWRDLWLFSYLCNGINFRDMIFLKYKNITDDEVSFIRSKTKDNTGQHKIIRAALTPLMKEIMERSGNGANGKDEEFIFRHAKGNESPMQVSTLIRNVISSCNATLKILAADLGIPAFSTYAARHSFATVLKKCGTDISFISESLGHSSITMTEHYLAGYDKEERRKYAGILING